MEQTYVLKLMRELDVKTDSAQGHVESVKTGKALRFHSISELLSFLEDTNKEAAQDQTEPEINAF